jgi:hypothetical protein
VSSPKIHTDSSGASKKKLEIQSPSDDILWLLLRNVGIAIYYGQATEAHCKGNYTVLANTEDVLFHAREDIFAGDK